MALFDGAMDALGQQQSPNSWAQTGIAPPEDVTVTTQLPNDQMPILSSNYDPELAAAAVHHGRISTALKNAMNAMTGGDTQMQIIRNQDGSYAAVPVQSTAGRWGRVAAAALAGAAQGFAVGTGPGGAGRAAAAGLQIGTTIGEGNQDATLKLAAQMNKQDRDRQLFNANMILLNQHAMKGTFDMHQAQIKATEDEQDRQDRIAKSMQADNAQHLFIPSDGNPDTLMTRVAQQINSNPDLRQAHTDGRTAVFTKYGPDGNPIGVDVYSRPIDTMHQLNTEPYERHVTRVSADGTKLEDVNLGTIGAGSMPKDKLMAMMQSDAVQDAKTKIEWAKIEGDVAQRKLALEAQRIAASAAARDAQGRLILGQDKEGNPLLYNDRTGAIVEPSTGIFRPGTKEKIDAANAKVLEPINSALAYANDYLNKPPTGTSDEALMEKFFDLAKPSSGFRMSTPQMDMLKNSRNWMGSAEAKVRHFTTGTWFSDEQRKQIVQTMNDVGKAKIAGHLATVGGAAPAAAPAAATPAAPAAPAETLPPAALSQLKEGQTTTFGNGQQWTLQNGKPTRVK
jgi:hypothetical protein